MQLKLVFRFQALKKIHMICRIPIKAILGWSKKIWIEAWINMLQKGRMSIAKYSSDLWQGYSLGKGYMMERCVRCLSFREISLYTHIILGINFQFSGKSI